MYNTETYKVIARIRDELDACATIEELKVALASILTEIIECIPTQQDPSEE